MRHFVPLDVKTRKKISAKIYLFDFVFLIAAATFALMTQDLVIPPLRIVYIGFVLLVGVYLTRPSNNNPDKRIYQSMWFFLRRPRTAYIPVETERKRIQERSVNKP